MLNLRQKQNILLMYLREGKSQREIARITGVDRKTISKYIKQYEASRETLMALGECADSGELIQAMVETPKYTVGLRPKRVLTEEMEQKIQEHLTENEEKRKKGLRKQLKKPIDIHDALNQEGFEVSYSTVLRIIRQWEKTTKEAFIKAESIPGESCEFDWGEVKIVIKGRRSVYQMAVFTPSYGNWRYARLFTKQTTECFQESHALFYQKIGGVHQTMVYDNMKVAVKRFVGTEKEPTEGLLKLSFYYGFHYRFCNVASGNEKGHVERSVEFIRRKAFAFQDTFDSLEEANVYLEEVCEKLNRKPKTNDPQQRSAEALLEIERPYLLSAPPPFDAARIQMQRVDKYSTIIVDQSHYSVPDHLVGEMLKVKVYSNRILCFHQDQLMAEHVRRTGCHEWSLQVEHYLGTLKKKPGALASSVALQQAHNKIKTIYKHYYTNKPKEFVELLQFIHSGFSWLEVDHSIGELRSLHPSHVTTEKIKSLCQQRREAQLPKLMTTKDTQEIEAQSWAHLKEYDDLFSLHTLGTEEEIA